MNTCEECIERLYPVNPTVSCYATKYTEGSKYPGGGRILGPICKSCSNSINGQPDLPKPVENHGIKSDRTDLQQLTARVNYLQRQVKELQLKNSKKRTHPNINRLTNVYKERL